MLVHDRRRKRFAAALAVVLVAVLGVIGLATPDPAAAIPGLLRVAQTSDMNDDPTKSVVAGCPKGRHVVGGGAQVNEPGNQRLVRLTRLEPREHSHPFDTHDDLYYVRAEAPGLSRSYSWSVTAYAICAYKYYLRDFEIVRTLVSSDSAAFQHVASRCPSGTVAWGSGAEIHAINNAGKQAPSGQIGLQLMRTSGPLDIVRATGRESLSGYNGRWHLSAYAICANRLITGVNPQPWHLLDPKLQVDGNVSSGTFASARCPDGYFRTHGLGGGGGLTDGGPVWLRAIVPHFDLKGLDVRMTGPLYPSIGGMIAHQTCAL